MDRRQKRTRKLIYEAFSELMRTKHYREVSVAEIIERADIGRSTFYAHFETKDELLNQMCLELFAHIFEGVSEYCDTHMDLDASGLVGKLSHLLYHLRDKNGGMGGKLLVEHEPHFIANFDDNFTKLLQSYVEPLPDVDVELQLLAMTASFVQTLTWWYSQGAKMSPELVAQQYLALWKTV